MVENSNVVGGNFFWIYFTFIEVISLLYLGFWSFHNESIKGLAISLIFSVMIIFTHIFTRGEVFRLAGSLGANSFWFFVGFIGWGSIVITKRFFATGGQGFVFSLLSTISPERNVLLSEISAELPRFWDFFINNVSNPIIEEAFWLLAIPFAVLWLLDIISAEYTVLSFLKDNKIARFIILLLVSGITFPLFHVRGFILVFILGAFIFRAFVLTIYWGDEIFDLLKNIVVVASFGVGVHMANNWLQDGLFYGLGILSSNPVGIMFLASFFIMFLLALEYIGTKLLDMIPWSR